MNIDHSHSRASGTSTGLITVVPFGPVAGDLLRVVADSIQGLIRLPVDVHDTVALPDEAFMAPRGQYNAMALLKFLAENHGDSSLKVIGITAMDITNPILTYVFGEAYMDGTAAVMSYARLATTPAGDPIPWQHFLERVVKVAVHEIGHTFNLAHCHRGRCVMRSSHNLLQLDEKLNYLCDYCEVFLADALKKELKTLPQDTRRREFA